VPVLALLGFINAGFDARDAAQRNPAAAAAHIIAAPGTAAEAHAATVHNVTDMLSHVYLGLVVGAIGLRALRN